MSGAGAVYWKELKGIDPGFDQKSQWDKQSEAFRKVLDEMYELHQSKGGDYGRKTDHYYNIRESAKKFGHKPSIGALIRAQDKLNRILSFEANGKLNNESVTDSYRDYAVYTAIAYALHLEEKET